VAARLPSILRERRGEPIFRGIENYYLDLISASLQFRAKEQPVCSVHSGGVGGGWGSTVTRIFRRPGPGFHVNILSAAGISYMVNDHWKLEVGAPLPALSNGGTNRS